MLNFACIGRNFVVDEMLSAFEHFPDIKLLGVYSRNESTGRQYADKWGAKKVYTTLAQLAEDKDIDAVYIASPNYCHAQQSIAMLNAGKHVLCEKPFASSFEDAKAMVEAAEKNGRVIMEAMMSAHVPGTGKIKELLPRIGKVRRINFSFCQYSSRYDSHKAGVAQNAFDPTLHNGSFMDMGVYPLHLMLQLFGAPDSFNSKAVFLPQSIDGEGTLTAEYKDMLATLTWSKITQGYLPSDIQGEDGSILIDRISKPTELTLILRDGTKEVYETLGGKPVMYYELYDFIKQIKGEAMPRFNKLSLLEAQIMESARGQMGIDFIRK